ncbi:MAG: hypothetical protein Faunusvirus16_12 [Faunusvirus sp.]|jgi:hypothetical protein|uniref:Uncharacterized protein n=1 Tax=Faunusvirus sp. TaxID=2487766 RepID=A0A3G4ZX39_9VIRU|nr:MAG: hypothetical protein Faunusvirus16_12 [Faunusvirus sp.]
MADANIHAGHFLEMIGFSNNTKCIRYINMYTDFHNILIIDWSMLMWTINYRRKKLIIEFIRKGVDVNHKSQYGASALTAACVYDDYEDIVIMLIKAGAYFVDIIDTHIYKHEKTKRYIREMYRQHIILVINSGDNAIAGSFKKTYVSGIIDMISEFII